jgi:hypothetical protein
MISLATASPLRRNTSAIGIVREDWRRGTESASFGRDCGVNMTDSQRERSVNRVAKGTHRQPFIPALNGRVFGLKNDNSIGVHSGVQQCQSQAIPNGSFSGSRS